MKILAVEDDVVAQLVLEAALKSLGHEVVLAHDAATAWEVLREQRLRVVVSDWLMPGRNGLDLCRDIRGQAGDYVYFILLTQQTSSPENQQTAIDAGVDDFLTKPVQVQELKMRLHVAARILNFTAEVRQLESFLPICSYCKKVRDDKDYWQRIESYLHKHTGASFSHSVCPECYQTEVVPMLREAGIEPPKRLD